MSQSSYLPCMPPVYADVGNMTAKAVNYFDEDGYFGVNGVPRCDTVYFMEAFHYAIELGHQY